MFSLHIGKSGELDARHSTLPVEKAAGEVRSHIRVPGGVYAVTIADDHGILRYGAINAAPMEVYGQVAVRWRPQPKGTRLIATLWKQKLKTTDKISGTESLAAFLNASCTKLREFSFSLV